MVWRIFLNFAVFVNFVIFAILVTLDGAALQTFWMNFVDFVNDLANYRKFRSFRSCVQSWTLLKKLENRCAVINQLFRNCFGGLSFETCFPQKSIGIGTIKMLT